MRRIKKKVFLGFSAACVAVLGCVRACNPEVMGEGEPELVVANPSQQEVEASPATDLLSENEGPAVSGEFQAQESNSAPAVASNEYGGKYHPVGHVPGFERTFPDLQEVQIVAARKWGVSPVRNRQQAEQRKSELVFVGSNPYYTVGQLNHSIPYLVPRAADLLQTISRNFLDSLAIKGKPLHKVVVTSLLRTEADVERLMRYNGNASDQSCHRFGTTFDISHVSYETVSPPGETRREVPNDTLKWVLSEVLRDLRQQGLCYIKYEKKQSCFHITTR